MKTTTFVTDNGIVYNLLVDYRRESMGDILTKYIQPERIRHALEYYDVHIDSIMPYSNIIVFILICFNEHSIIEYIFNNCYIILNTSCFRFLFYVNQKWSDKNYQTISL